MQPSAENTTTPPAPITTADATAAAAEVPTLVLLWSRSRPDRIGEFAPLTNSEAWVFGRGSDDDGAHPRIEFFRERPGTFTNADPFDDPSLSRTQFRLLERAVGVEIDHRGTQTTLVVDRTQVLTRTILRDGNVISIRDQHGDLYLFLYTTRPRALPVIDYPSTFAFGEIDDYGILGESGAAWKLRAQIALAAKSSRHALVHGESGTGKELAAQAIHALSRRSARPCVSRSAATLPTELIDAELFGNGRNYPNPGMADRPGLIGEADGSTLYLDEIGELPHSMQARLLRVLDAGEYHRLGDAIARRADVRLVGATNRDLDDIKHDVLARFAERVELPSLAARREDIPLFIRHFALRYAMEMPEIAARFVRRGHDGRDHVSVAPQLVAILVRREYRGNVRDLDRLVWEAIKVSTGTTIGVPDLLREESAAPSPGLRKAEPSADPEAPSVEAVVSGIVRRSSPSRDIVVTSLAANRGNVTRTARDLGLRDRNQLYRLMVKLGIKIEVT